MAISRELRETTARRDPLDVIKRAGVQYAILFQRYVGG
jgi:hypothetical protein